MSKTGFENPTSGNYVVGFVDISGSYNYNYIVENSRVCRYEKLTVLANRHYKNLSNFCCNFCPAF